MSQALANVRLQTHDKLASPMLLAVIALGFDAAFRGFNTSWQPVAWMPAAGIEARGRESGLRGASLRPDIADGPQG